jgi:hypothetical protein
MDSYGVALVQRLKFKLSLRFLQCVVDCEFRDLPSL